MKIKITIICAIILLQLSYLKFAKAEASKELSQQQVLLSADKNYPKILSYYEKVNASESKALGSLGFFDVKLKQNYSDKSRGFYDGKLTDTSLEKELGFLGAKAYGGYRKSFGSFADYDGDSITNDGGEYRAGAKFSLLKDSMIDQNRLDVILSNLDVKESKIQLQFIKKTIERDATKSYWRWVAAVKIFEIYEDLYQLSLKRQMQLEERLKKGDVAQIIVAENKKNILRRKSVLEKARQECENGAIYLSLFWRSENGLPIIPKNSQVPKINFAVKKIDDKKSDIDLRSAFENRPELKILNIQKESNLSQLKYAQNLYKPKLDVDVGASKDLGYGSASRVGTNNYVNLDFVIPLQQREARGKTAQYQSKLKSIKYETQLTEEQIKAELAQIKVQISSIVEIYHNLHQEVGLAELLENSEREKFKHGASNFFLVNIREQDTASSKVSLIEISEKYQSALADYKLAIFLD